MSDTRKDQLGSFVFPNAVKILDRLTPELERLGYSADEINSVAMDLEKLLHIVLGPELAQIRAIAEREAWRPIESAPREIGHHVLLFGDGDAIRECWYIARWHDGRWKLFNDARGDTKLRPTHWRPLPAPPPQED